ncbi:MAG: arabinose isomerase [Chloroflexi bacterium]|nr:arabinose isomerase [Chloroflexota bacterium]
MITSTNARARIGIMLAGHREYWPQFPGLKEELIKNGEYFTSLIAQHSVEILGSVFVDTLEDAYAAGVQFKSQDVDLLFVYLTTYVSSGRYVQGALAAGCPVVLVGLQRPILLEGETTLISLTGAGSPCQMPEAWNAFERSGKPAVDLIFGELYNDKRVQTKLADWCRAATAIRAMKGAIFGSLGHTYEGMLDMNYDPTSITKQFGVHVRFVEMCELVEYVEGCSDAELKRKLDEVNTIFEYQDKSFDPTTKDIVDDDVIWAARCAVGLENLVDNNNLSGLAYYYMGENNSIYERVASNLMIGNSLLTTRGIALAGESDMKTCLAMYITSALGAGGSFAELAYTDFANDIVIVGHDGPHDLRISDKKPTIRGLSLMHGKKGYGVSVEFSIRTGPMTMVGIGSDMHGDYRFIVAEGESQAGWVPPIGNTLTRGYFGPDIADFIEEWSKAMTCHHMSLSIGHNGAAIEKVGKLLGMPVVHIR